MVEELIKDLPIKFVAERTLQRLARWLRMLGADVLCDYTLGGDAALRLARALGRPLLTRDKRLRTAPDALYLESHLFRDQLREVMARYPFNPRAHAFSRCLLCNALLQKVPRDVVARRVPPFFYASHEEFACCPQCLRVYWDATHPERVRRELDALGW